MAWFPCNLNSNLINGSCLLSFITSFTLGGGTGTYDWKNVYCNENYAVLNSNSITIRKPCKIKSYSYTFTKGTVNVVIYRNGNPILTIANTGRGNNVDCNIDLNVGDVITCTDGLGSSSATFAINFTI